MKNGTRLREWATPVAIGAFGLSAVTGIMLFFGADVGLTRPVHEWLSWLLVLGTIFHLIANWRLSMRYASRTPGRRIVIVFFVLTCASLMPFGENHREHSSMKIADALIQAPLSGVAQIAGHRPGEVANMLGSQGVHVEGKEQTVREIALKNNRPPLSLLDIIF